LLRLIGEILRTFNMFDGVGFERSSIGLVMLKMLLLWFLRWIQVDKSCSSDRLSVGFGRGSACVLFVCSRA